MPRKFKIRIKRLNKESNTCKKKNLIYTIVHVYVFNIAPKHEIMNDVYLIIYVSFYSS